MSKGDAMVVETDPRFPSGRWTGYFLQPAIPGRHQMELLLTFHQGQIEGEGRDWVGAFLVEGNYDLADGKCHWIKQYLLSHRVYYQGFNEGKGIWGTWSIAATNLSTEQHGGFHIWPEGQGDSSNPELSEALDLPAYEEEPAGAPQPAAAPA
jgi:hypothetical protein